MKKVKTLLKDILFVLIAIYIFVLNGALGNPFAEWKGVSALYILIGLLLGAVCIMSGTEAKNKGKIVRMVFYYIVSLLTFLSSIYQIFLVVR